MSRKSFEIQETCVDESFRTRAVVPRSPRCESGGFCSFRDVSAMKKSLSCMALQPLAMQPAIRVPRCQAQPSRFCGKQRGLDVPVVSFSCGILDDFGMIFGCFWIFLASLDVLFAVSSLKTMLPKAFCARSPLGPGSYRPGPSASRGDLDMLSPRPMAFGGLGELSSGPW